MKFLICTITFFSITFSSLFSTNSMASSIYYHDIFSNEDEIIDSLFNQFDRDRDNFLDKYEIEEIYYAYTDYIKNKLKSNSDFEKNHLGYFAYAFIFKDYSEIKNQKERSQRYMFAKCFTHSFCYKYRHSTRDANRENFRFFMYSLSE